MTERELWMALRKSLLDQVDTIERMLGISPTTAEMRSANKEGRVALRAPAERLLDDAKAPSP